MANVLDLYKFIETAQRAGRDLVNAISGFELDTDERQELTEAIDRAIEVWKLARSAVKKPVSAEAEEFLRSIS